MKLLLACIVALVLASAPVARALDASTAISQQRRPAPADIRVWVNLPTKVYHCPGTRWYGATKKGEYMTQAQAKQQGHRAAYGRECR